MKNLRHIGAVIFLTCALSLSAFAGEGHTPGKDGQPETPFAGEMDCPLAVLLGILQSALF